MTTTSPSQEMRSVSPHIYWRLLMLATLVLGSLWIYVSRVPADLASSDRTFQAPMTGFLAPDFTLAPLVDMLAMSLVSAGCFMGGVVTSWIAWDLIRQKVLRRFWLWLLVLAGLALAPAPFLALHPYPLAIALGFWLMGSLWLATRPRLPSPFSEWP